MFSGDTDTGLCLLKQGNTAGAARFQSIMAKEATSCILGDCGPICLQIINYPCSLGVILELVLKWCCLFFLLYLST